VAWLVAGAAAQEPVAFRGTLEPAAGGEAAGRKAFELRLWLEPAENGHSVYWVLEEGGPGEWPWTERFGRLQANSKWQSATNGAALRYRRDDGTSSVPLALPLLATPEALAEGVTWEEAGARYRVAGTSRVGQRETWEIPIERAPALREVCWLDRGSPLVLRREQRVVLGRGVEHQLRLEWVSGEVAQAAPPPAALVKLLSLREGLKIARGSERVAWQPEQLALLERELPGLVATNDASLGRLIRAAQRETSLQRERAAGVVQLAAALVGREAPAFTSTTLAGDPVTEAQLKGKVTVLHFWEYRDEPLVEPYGQVGYLSFLGQRYRDRAVQVWGAVVDGRLADAEQAPAVRRGVRRLREFMNLEYPLLLDSGGLIKQFGDPRPLGAELPLWIVVGTDGKIAHYHAGLYTVRRDEGLQELDAVVGRLLREQR
jgi:hypothetical protein